MSAVDQVRDLFVGTRAELRKVIVGQDDTVELLLVALLCEGHALIEGVPGTAKTLLVRSLARILGCRFNRVQFTPDLMPSDVVGTSLFHMGEGVFKFRPGPVFSNFLLGDEINRAPAKTQSALLQAMEEGQTTVDGDTYALPEPFFVLATQNPLEQEGTYPLPEAQLDRFMFMVNITYPKLQEEREIIKSTTSEQVNEPMPVLSGKDILAIQSIVRRVPVSDHVINYAIDIVRATRPNEPESPQFIKDWLAWGAGPRAAQYLILGAKARAIMHARYNVSCKDVQALASTVLRHRMFTNFNADAEGITTDNVVAQLLKTVPEPKADQYRDS